ncbi:hypothetical protein Bca52824_065214 [Brassica carinata]|uniref:C2H2-type domain-containing protein n=1 Tax=Brassica carinata TaxID=52824 RepID=A0A8X7U9R9_BRACI|nr:hypothetical protein Bca52824_065214 [Brassica carinata]
MKTILSPLCATSSWRVRHFATRVDTLRYSRFFLSAGHVTNPHGIRVPSSVFLLSGGLHNESTQKVRVMIRSTVQLKRCLEDSAGFVFRERKLHYSSDWHSYNLKRKVAGAPGVTEELFEARQSALAMEKGKSDEKPMLYTCRVCGKSYRSSKAHEQHCKSWRHVLRVSQGTASNGDEDVAIVTPLPRLFKNKDNEESDNE